MPTQEEFQTLLARHPDITLEVLAAKTGTTSSTLRRTLTDKHSSRYMPMHRDLWAKILKAVGET